MFVYLTSVHQSWQRRGYRGPENFLSLSASSLASCVNSSSRTGDQASLWIIIMITTIIMITIIMITIIMITIIIITRRSILGSDGMTKSDCSLSAL